MPAVIGLPALIPATRLRRQVPDFLDRRIWITGINELAGSGVAGRVRCEVPDPGTAKINANCTT